MITYYRDENNIPYALLPHQHVEGVMLTPIRQEEHQALMAAQAQRRAAEEETYRQQAERARKRRQEKRRPILKSVEEKLAALGFSKAEISLLVTGSLEE